MDHDSFSEEKQQTMITRPIYPKVKVTQIKKVGKVNEAGEGQDRRISETVAMPVNYGAKAVFILY